MSRMAQVGGQNGDGTRPRKVSQRIGYREFVDLPDWGIRGIKAKADTGARSSAIDVADLEELPRDRVRFHVVLSRKNRMRRVTVEAKIVRRTIVKSSLGHRDERLTVETTLRIGTVEKVVEVGLVCRESMICRMLLGRQALAGDFLVDSRRTYLYGKPVRKPRRPAERPLQKKRKRPSV